MHARFGTTVMKCILKKLENIQLEAARIVTGLPIFTKKEFIYRELGWQTLENRRNNRKLSLLFNIRNGKSPEYLQNILPPTIEYF